MTGIALPLLTAQGETITYRLARLGALTEWWHWAVLVLLCSAIASYAAWMYRRDSVELPTSLAVLLTLLRLVAFAGILFYYFKLERRAERELTKNSRVVVMVDTSQSMSIRDGVGDDPASTSWLQPFLPQLGGTSAAAGELRRADHVLAAVAHSDLLTSLRQDHDVVVYRFDQEERPVEVATLLKEHLRPESNLGDRASLAAALEDARRLAMIAAILGGIALLAGAIHWLTRRRQPITRSGRDDRTAWALLISMVCLIAGLIVFATASLRDPRLSLATVANWSDDLPEAEQATEEVATINVADIDWVEQLRPRGIETRLGDSLKSILANERGGTAAGVVVFTDGNNNAGVDMLPAIATARDAAIPIHVVGLGSDKLPLNARVVDVEAPQRAYLGDKFTVTGHVMISGLTSGQVNVELLSLPATSNEPMPLEVIEEERTLEFADGQLVTTRFEIEPAADQVGKREYRLRVKPLERETETDDNQRSAKVEIVDRKDRILLLAGGPMREFIFLRNQLFRDETQSTHVTVLLQSARPGIAQEAHEIIYEFPQTADELFEYDCIVAFDPDWDALDELQIELLDRFVGEKAGGLIVVAGPVFTPQWSTRRDAGKLRTVKKLYPVHFYSPAAASLGLSRFGSSSAWPIEFTREGQEAPFLWLGSDSVSSRRSWTSFPGIYGYYAVRDPKPGATVYSRFGDPDARLDDEFPIYMAAHFYGAGRVFFLGSGEMWRTRAVDESLFEEFYTKLIRWAGEGRLLRDSNRGLLLVDKDRCYVGERVTIRATLNDAQHRPLTANEVAATLVTPKGLRVPLTLRKLQDSSRDGIYAEQFTAAQEGDYRIEITPPDADGELLVREVRARIPDSELRDSKRNDALMADLAAQTDGEYFTSVGGIVPQGETPSPLIERIDPREQVSILPGAPDKRFEERLMLWLIVLVGGVLCSEWLIRRLNKLA
jgi:hypothetical protein